MCADVYVKYFVVGTQIYIHLRAYLVDVLCARCILQTHITKTHVNTHPKKKPQYCTIIRNEKRDLNILLCQLTFVCAHVHRQTQAN